MVKIQKIKHGIARLILSPFLMILLIWTLIAGPPADNSEWLKRMRVVIRTTLITAFAAAAISWAIAILGIYITSTPVQSQIESFPQNHRVYFYASLILATTIATILGYITAETVARAFRLKEMYPITPLIFSVNVASVITTIGMGIAGKWSWPVAAIAFTSGISVFLLVGRNEIWTKSEPHKSEQH